MLPKITTIAGLEATVTLPPEKEHFLVQKPPILLCTHSYKAETQTYKWQCQNWIKIENHRISSQHLVKSYCHT